MTFLKTCLKVNRCKPSLGRVQLREDNAYHIALHSYQSQPNSVCNNRCDTLDPLKEGREWAGEWGKADPMGGANPKEKKRKANVQAKAYVTKIIETPIGLSITTKEALGTGTCLRFPRHPNLLPSVAWTTASVSASAPVLRRRSNPAL